MREERMAVAIHVAMWDSLGTKNTIVGVSDYFSFPFKPKMFHQNTCLDALKFINFISNSKSL